VALILVFAKVILAIVKLIMIAERLGTKQMPFQNALIAVRVKILHICSAAMEEESQVL
jgi:hypothetical protein